MTSRPKIILASLISLVLITISVYHAVALANNPFGGQILYRRYCNCSDNWLLLIGPPRGGWFIYQPGVTRVYAYGQITKVGAWTLGTWETTAVCVYGDRCQNGQTGKLINIVGTSL